MNKKLITALVFAFMAVKNPVNLVGIEKAYAASTKEIEQANAVSEANIAVNLDGFYQTNESTNEEKANTQIENYRKEIAEQKRIEAEALARENESKVNKLTSAGLSARFITNYVSAQNKYGVPWEVIAAVHRVETHQSGDTAVTSYAGAQGPMQFMPSTFSAFAQDGNGDGTASIGSVDDAIYTAANYMASNGAANGNVVNALYRYNHDYGYVNYVLSIARSLGYSK